MDKNSKQPVSKYLNTFFPDGAKESEDRPSEDIKSSRLPPIKDNNTSISAQKSTVHAEVKESYSNDVLDDIWGSDFPEDFSEDCIILESKSEVSAL